MKNYLEFEKEIKTLETDLDNLKSPFGSEGISEVDTQKIANTEEEINQKLKMTYATLNSWQKTLVARHEDRPRASFYIKKIFSSFIPLSGDRLFAEDKSVTVGFGLIDNKSVLVIGQEKGEDLTSRIERNFGMMRPEGYRKCIRLMQLANRFQIPIVTFIDTPGAYPGIGAEERGQSEAIARSTDRTLSLGVPVISIIIGEGGSGGAIALAAANKVLMLEHSIYTVASPEASASILWRSSEKAELAATAMKITSDDLKKLGVIDEIIDEPLGGAHRERSQAIMQAKIAIVDSINELSSLSPSELRKHRREKFLKIGRDL